MGKPQATVPPWHLWGNTERVSAPANAFTNPGVFVTEHTLVRVQYGRPETWRFLFAAELLSAPAGGPGNQSNVNVYYELFAGIGRANIRIPFWVQLPILQWNLGAAPPLNQVLWTNLSSPSTRARWFDDGTPQLSYEGDVFTDTLVADHISVVAHVQFTTDIAGAAPAVVQVSGQVAPNTHVRPDWHEIDPVFSGETEGR